MAILKDADAFLEALENADADVCETYPDFYCDWGFSRKAIEDLLLNIPTIEAKPVVHGEWREREVELEPEHGVVRKGTKEKVIECCECGWRVAGEKRKKTNYCPNCGADMRGET